MKFSELQQKTRSITQQIQTSEGMDDHDAVIKLKRELYQTKLQMLDLIEQEEKRNGIKAGDLITMVQNMPHLPRYAIGIDAIDAELSTDEDRRMGIKGGIETGTFIQFAGESGTGKTTLILDILSHISSYSQCVFFNFEMGIKRIGHRLQRKLKNDIQRDNLIIDSHSRELELLCMEITLYARDGIKFFAIDSRMKIEVNQEIADHQKTSLISSKLSKLAQEKDIIIFLINQMSDEAIKDGRMVLKNGGDQKYDADMMWFYIMDKKDEHKRILRCTKNRQDERTFKVELSLNQYGQTQGYRGFNSMAVEIKYEPKIEMGYTL
jgi:energy-coupling factor transporter ATP-binding protein EcfA2